MVSPNLGATLVVFCCVLLVRAVGAEAAVVAAEQHLAKKNSASVVRQERPFAERSATAVSAAEDEDAAWEPRSSLPLPGRDRMQAAILDDNMYIFGGQGYDANGAATSVLSSVCVYDTKAHTDLPGTWDCERQQRDRPRWKDFRMWVHVQMHWAPLRRGYHGLCAVHIRTAVSHQEWHRVLCGARNTE